MSRLVLSILLALMACALTACSSKADQACKAHRFDGARFTICRFDPARHDLKLILDDAHGQPLRSLDRLRQSLGPQKVQVRFAMNAGMFDNDGDPIGLYVEDGFQRHVVSQTDGPGNFHLKPNGVFWLDDAGGHVAATDAYLAAKPHPRFATQSGPMLVVDGALHPSITPDGPSQLVRNGVGACPNGDVQFVISEEPVSFGKFARLFRDDLKCPNALFLDGTVSSLWSPSQHRLDNGPPLGPLIVVSNRPSSPSRR
jgi:uncharacterized protein YigE (DUF2233 family)